jgi:isopentenyl phosphate kinase
MIYDQKRFKVTVVKLGGSLVTHKDRGLSFDPAALRSIGRQLKNSGLPSRNHKLILIHGGGSFGHYYAKRFGLTTEKRKVAARGIAKTTGAMLKLHSQIREVLDEFGINLESILPRELIEARKIALSETGLRKVRNAFSNDLIPISFGYVDIFRNGASIVSGDTICEAIAKSIEVDRQIFAMDVDGVYPTRKIQGPIIRTLRNSTEFLSKRRKYDVTGGIASKVSLGFRLREKGTEVFFVNGKEDERLLKLILGRYEVLATAIDPRKGI